MASSNTTNADKYRSFLSEDDVKNVKWRYGSAPNYDKVNKLFEEGRTKVRIYTSINLIYILTKVV